MTREQAELTDDQLLSALQVGDVVIEYGASRPPAGLEQFARSVAPPFTRELAATGDGGDPGAGDRGRQAWWRWPGRTCCRVGAFGSGPESFVGFWLGRGAPGT